NQQQFTEAEPDTIPTIAVVEEAQSVLTGRDGASAPYIEWVKEGRKYDLGALLITQQPGSIPVEILSQGDNWFIFHLLSSADLVALKKANSHFSDDLLSSLLNEPIPGQGVFWSSVGGKTYPVSLRALSFERLYKMQDPSYSRTEAATYTAELKRMFAAERDVAQATLIPQIDVTEDGAEEEEEGSTQGHDAFAVLEQRSIDKVKANEALMARIRSNMGAAWGTIKAALRDALPDHVDDKDGMAYHLVPKFMDQSFGPHGEAWESYKNAQRNYN